MNSSGNLASQLFLNMHTQPNGCESILVKLLDEKSGAENNPFDFSNSNVQILHT
jgi:hypothetical protein